METQNQIKRTLAQPEAIEHIRSILDTNVNIKRDIGDVANLYNLRYVCCMVRQARLDAPGVLHHIMARGIERRPIFIDDRDRDEFVRRLSDLAWKGN
jgi:hypothetical protein